MDEITIKRSEYDELKAALARVTELAQKVTSLEEIATKVTGLESQVEKLEIDKKAAEDALAAETAKRETLEETARAATLSGERLGKLGSAFTAKLPDTVTAKLNEQAKTMSDEEWTERLSELESLTGVKPDEAAAAGEPGSVTTTETASTQLGGTTASTGSPSRASVHTVLGGLFKDTRPQTPAGK